MKCPECGQEAVGEDKFCNHCGATLPGQETAAPAADQDLIVDDAAAAIADDATAIADDAAEELEIIPDDTVSELESLGEEPEAAFEEAIATLEETELLPSEDEAPLIDLEPFPTRAETLPDMDTPPPPPVVKAKKKPNTGLIIAIVVLVLLLLCCCCAMGIIAANYEQIIEALEGAY